MDVDVITEEYSEDATVCVSMLGSQCSSPVSPKSRASHLAHLGRELTVADAQGFKIYLCDPKLVESIVQVADYVTDLSSMLGRLNSLPAISADSLADYRSMSEQVTFSPSQLDAINSADAMVSQLLPEVDKMHELFKAMSMCCINNASSLSEAEIDRIILSNSVKTEPNKTVQNLFVEKSAVELTIAVLQLLLESTGEEAREMLPKLLNSVGLTLDSPGAQIPVWVIEQQFLGTRTHNVVRAGFRFLQLIANQNPNAKQHLADNCWFLQDHLESPFGAVETYIVLYRNNLDLLQKLADGDFRQVVNSLTRKHEGSMSGAQLLHLISMMCVIEDDDGSVTSIPINQLRIFDALFPDKLEMFSPMRIVGEDSFQLPEVSMPNRKDWVPVAGLDDLQFEDLLAARNDTLDETQRVLRFHYFTILLLARLCCGRNRTIADYVLRNIGFFSVRYRALTNMVVNLQLPATYRSALVKLLVALFVDREPQYQLNELRTFWLWQDATKEWDSAIPQVWGKVTAASICMNCLLNCARVCLHHLRNWAETGHYCLPG